LTTPPLPDRFIEKFKGGKFFIESFPPVCRSNWVGENDVANFYENDKNQASRWEEIGGFNIYLLMEIRNAMMDVK